MYICIYICICVLTYFYAPMYTSMVLMCFMCRGRRKYVCIYIFIYSYVFKSIDITVHICILVVVERAMCGRVGYIYRWVRVYA